MMSSLMVLVAIAYKFLEIVPFLILWRDAKKSKVCGVSAQTCAAFTISVVMSSLNQPPNVYDRWINTCMTFVTASIGLCCTMAVAKATDVASDDDLIPRWSLPRWAQLSVLYVVAGVMTVVVSFGACHLKPLEFVRWVKMFPAGILCTYQNFLHGTALLPQLVICRQRGFVAPAAGRFLMITGVKHVLEFLTDLTISVGWWKLGKINLHEVSFMSADLFASVMLLDFMYLVMKSSNLCNIHQLLGWPLSAKGKAKQVCEMFSATSLPLEIV